MNILKSIYLYTIKTGGCSYSFQEFRTIKEGYSVSIDKIYERCVDIEDFTTIDLKDYILDNYSFLWEYDNHHLGTWIEGGAVYMDISVQYDTLEEAIEAAEYYDQLAIYDHKKKETIYL